MNPMRLIIYLYIYNLIYIMNILFCIQVVSVQWLSLLWLPSWARATDDDPTRRAHRGEGCRREDRRDEPRCRQRQQPQEGAGRPEAERRDDSELARRAPLDAAFPLLGRRLERAALRDSIRAEDKRDGRAGASADPHSFVEVRHIETHLGRGGGEEG